MSPHKKRGRPRGPRQRSLVITGDVRIPSTILGWELDLLKPALGVSTTKDKRLPAEGGPREVTDAHQS